MTIEKARYWAENMTELSKNDRLWLNNPVIMQGVAWPPWWWRPPAATPRWCWPWPWP